MAKFDTTTKHLIEGGPRDWLTLAGLPVSPAPDAVTVVDAELSTVTTAADKLLRVAGPDGPYVAHVEFQASADADLDHRVLVYNVLARWRHRVPVRSVVYLLRPDAITRSLAGGVREVLEVGARLEFDYRLIRVWELPVEMVLNGGMGTLPLAPVTDVAEAELPGVIDRMRHRADSEMSTLEARELWATTHILLGLRYNRGVANVLMKGLVDMKESTTYMEIIEIGERRGEAKGQIEGERRVLIRLATKKFGSPETTAIARLEAITDPEILEQLSESLLTATRWDEWLGDVPSRA